jgi:hypothetical protein
MGERDANLLRIITEREARGLLDPLNLLRHLSSGKTPIEEKQ